MLRPLTSACSSSMSEMAAHLSPSLSCLNAGVMRLQECTQSRCTICDDRSLAVGGGAGGAAIQVRIGPACLTVQNARGVVLAQFHPHSFFVIQLTSTMRVVTCVSGAGTKSDTQEMPYGMRDISRQRQGTLEAHPCHSARVEVPGAGEVWRAGVGR